MWFFRVMMTNSGRKHLNLFEHLLSCVQYLHAVRFENKKREEKSLF
jgi:hypothetical protein